MKKVINIVLLILFLINANCFAEEVSSEEQTQNKEEVVQKPILKVKDIESINKADIVVIEGLNKITAKSYKYKVKVGSSVNFERLTVMPLVCWKSSPDQVSENKALLKIVETSIDGSKKQIFYGWMFSSSPSVSSMEHPMYDIRIVDCLKSNIAE